MLLDSFAHMVGVVVGAPINWGIINDRDGRQAPAAAIATWFIVDGVRE